MNTLSKFTPIFSLAGTYVKASGTDAQPDAAGSVLWRLGSFHNKQGFCVKKIAQYLA